jgi:hypothetical protein
MRRELASYLDERVLLDVLRNGSVFSNILHIKITIKVQGNQ